jgi:inorganic pyrophosphatase
LSNLAEHPNRWNSQTRECKVIIETPKGRRNKFRYDPEFQLFSLAFLLPEGLILPYDFGFIPSALGEDGDPLDVLVIMDEPAHVGCLLDLRLIGVATHSYTHQKVNALEQLPKIVLDQVEEFFIHGVKHVDQLMASGIKAFHEKSGR